MPIDITTLTPTVSVGGGIFHHSNALELVSKGITHVINMQGEYDDGPIFEGTSVKTLWVPFHDVMKAPPKESMQQMKQFIQKAMTKPNYKLLGHCAAGVHRGPMAALLILCMTGISIENAEDIILSKRLIANFPKVYYDAVKQAIQDET